MAPIEPLDGHGEPGFNVPMYSPEVEEAIERLGVLHDRLQALIMHGDPDGQVSDGLLLEVQATIRAIADSGECEWAFVEAVAEEEDEGGSLESLAATYGLTPSELRSRYKVS